MKKTLVVLCSVATVVFLADCHPKAYPKGGTAETTKETKANTTASTSTTYTAEQVAKGKAIYEAECNKCHDLPKPMDHSVKSWNGILPKMFAKAGISQDNGMLIKAYVMSNVKQG